MNQDTIFLDGEGDNWYHRNKSALEEIDRTDWPLYLMGAVDDSTPICSVVELGCCNGYRLDRIAKLRPSCRLVGIDASEEAIADGRTRFPGLDLRQGLISDLPLQEEFDLVIVHFVLHWVDRSTVAKTVSEIDRVIKDDGLLILGDFLPDYPQRRRYHHLPDRKVYTYKQDYAKIFESLGTYREVRRFTFDHGDTAHYRLKRVGSGARGSCSLLHKSLEGYYPEV